MSFKKFGISVLVLALIYFTISYVFSRLFGREFVWQNRVYYALGFSITIMCIHWFLEKLKKKK